MFKRCLSMMLALCLLLTAFPAVFAEEDIDTVLFAAQEEPFLEAETDLELPDSEIAEDVTVADEATEEEAPEVEAPADEEAPADDAEAPAEENAETAEESDATEAPAESAPAAEAPVVIAEEPAAESAKLDNAEAALMEGAVAELVLTKNAKHTMTKGDYLQLNLNGLTAKSFKSSKKKVATVNSAGMIAAVGGGKTKIVVTITKKKKITLTLTVVDPTIPTSVYLTKDGAAVSGTITVNKGEPITLVPVAVAAATPSTGFKWSSSKKKIAKVSGAGVVTPKKVGTTTITVKTTRGKKKAKIKVKVIDPYKATAVYLSHTGLAYVNVKDKLQLTATMATASGAPSTSTLKWSSSNKKVATVSKNGLVTGKKKGTATITVKTSSGKKAKVKVKVLKAAGAAKGMILENSTLDGDNTLELGEQRDYLVTMNPFNATSNVVWTSDNTDVVRVVDSYRTGDLKWLATVVAVDIGYVTLTATDTVTGISQSYKVIVKPAVEPESISLPSGTSYTMSAGQTMDIPYVVLPSESLSHDFNRAEVVISDKSIVDIKWDSNNADRNCRGTMDYNLHVTAKKAGTTTVTIRLWKKPSVSATFTITVK